MCIYIYIYINHIQYYSAIIKNVILLFETTWMDLGNITQSKSNIVLHAESIKYKLISIKTDS